jgi:hypothetical protein
MLPLAFRILIFARIALWIPYNGLQNHYVSRLSDAFFPAIADIGIRQHPLITFPDNYSLGRYHSDSPFTASMFCLAIRFQSHSWSPRLTEKPHPLWTIFFIPEQARVDKRVCKKKISSWRVWEHYLSSSLCSRDNASHSLHPSPLRAGSNLSYIA